MNPMTHTARSRRWRFAGSTFIALTLAVYAAAQTAVVQSQDASGNRSMISAQQIVVTDGDENSKQTLEIRVDGDQVRVLRDGKEVPHAQLLQKDGHIIITDKDGNEVHAMSLKMEPGRYGYTFGDTNMLGGLFAQTAEAAPRVMLGVQMAEPGPALEKHLRLDPGTATLISGVYEGLPAHKAGIVEYDIIIKVDGNSPADNATIRKVLAERDPGSEVTFTVIHEGKPNEVTVTLLGYDKDALEKAKYLGGQHDGPMINWLRIPSVEGQDMTWQGSQVFVAPDLPLQQRMDLMPHMEHFQELHGHTSEAQKTNIEERLRMLDERLADLDKKLQRLIEQRLKNN